MKKILAIGIIATAILISLSGCNKQCVDTTYHFDYTIISLPNGETIEGKVDRWTDYSDGDQIQVVINGKTYLVHSGDVVLIS